MASQKKAGKDEKGGKHHAGGKFDKHLLARRNAPSSFKVNQAQLKKQTKKI